MRSPNKKRLYIPDGERVFFCRFTAVVGLVSASLTFLDKESKKG
jgi:hypothetical protein